MMKLFDIPIYAFSKNELESRINKTYARIDNKYGNADDELVKTALDKQFRSQRSWDYNHIVGYIRVFFRGSDVKANVFLDNKRYQWNTNVKTYFRFHPINGLHIRMKKSPENDDIRDAIYCLIEMARNSISSGLYVDLELFELLSPYLDFKELWKKHIGDQVDG